MAKYVFLKHEKIDTTTQKNIRPNTNLYGLGSLNLIVPVWMK
jgi:hypothetical protein|nr:hypothetical protein [Mucilaginibacter sp. E4BP6]